MYTAENQLNRNRILERDHHSLVSFFYYLSKDGIGTNCYQTKNAIMLCLMINYELIM